MGNTARLRKTGSLFTMHQFNPFHSRTSSNSSRLSPLVLQPIPSCSLTPEPVPSVGSPVSPNSAIPTNANNEKSESVGRQCFSVLKDMSHRGEGRESGLSNKPVFLQPLCLSLNNINTARNLKLTQVEHACSVCPLHKLHQGIEVIRVKLANRKHDKRSIARERLEVFQRGNTAWMDLLCGVAPRQEESRCLLVMMVGGIGAALSSLSLSSTSALRHFIDCHTYYSNRVLSVFDSIVLLLLFCFPRPFFLTHQQNTS